MNTLPKRRLQRPLAATLIALTGLFIGPVRLQADNNSLQSADQSVETSLGQTNQARRNYLTTVKEKGKDSPEAKAAQSNYQSARQNWQRQVEARRQLRRQARSQHGQSSGGGQKRGGGF